MMIPDEKNKKE